MNLTLENKPPLPPPTEVAGQPMQLIIVRLNAAAPGVASPLPMPLFPSMPLEPLKLAFDLLLTGMNVKTDSVVVYGDFHHGRIFVRGHFDLRAVLSVLTQAITGMTMGYFASVFGWDGREAFFRRHYAGPWSQAPGFLTMDDHKKEVATMQRAIEDREHQLLAIDKHFEQSPIPPPDTELEP